MKEIWKNIAEYEGLYKISNLGNVKSLKRNTAKERILKPFKDKDGYLKVHLSKNGIVKNCFIHRLVTFAFIENPYNLNIINHKDENKANNIYTNLEFCTPKYNSNYNNVNYRRGLKRRKPIVQIKENKIIKIWSSALEASETLKISRGNIVSCLKGERNKTYDCTWKYLKKEWGQAK